MIKVVVVVVAVVVVVIVVDVLVGAISNNGGKSSSWRIIFFHGPNVEKVQLSKNMGSKEVLILIIAF